MYTSDCVICDELFPCVSYFNTLTLQLTAKIVILFSPYFFNSEKMIIPTGYKKLKYNEDKS